MNSTSSPGAEMAADIAQLCTIMQAAARHFKIDVPTSNDERVPEPKSVTGAVRPKEDGYDEETTIKHRAALVPTESISKTLFYNLNLSGLKVPPVRMKIWPQNRSPSGEGLYPLIEWFLDGSISRFVREYGYTEEGELCVFDSGDTYSQSRDGTIPGASFTERILIRDKSRGPSPPWDGQRFGKEWFFQITHESDLSNLSAALCQLVDSGFNGEYPEDLLGHSPLGVFLALYRSNWDSEHYYYLQNSPTDDPGPFRTFQYHLRVLSMSNRRPISISYLRRESGSIRRANDFGRLFVCEKRMAVAVRTTVNLDLPVFSQVVLADPVGLFALVHAKEEPLSLELLWTKANIQPSIRATAISVFAVRIHTLFGPWFTEWLVTLRHLESELDVQVTDILSRKKRRKLMYDDSDLAISELYFFISQMLRFSSEWIQESIDDLRTLGQQIESKHFSPKAKKKNPEASFLPDDPEAQTAVLEVFRQNWKSLTSMQGNLADELLSRIKKMQEEVSSLREGLFTATAVSEATKSKQLSHYILVFTVVTIFYLPLSFVAALYALDLFSWDDPNQKVSFVVTLILVAGTTYGFAGYLVWFVRKPKRRQQLKKAKRVKTLGKLFKRQKKKDRSDLDTNSDSESE